MFTRSLHGWRYPCSMWRSSNWKYFGYYFVTTTIFLLYFNTCIKYNTYSILIDFALHGFQSPDSSLGLVFLFIVCRCHWWNVLCIMNVLFFILFLWRCSLLALFSCWFALVLFIFWCLDVEFLPTFSCCSVFFLCCVTSKHPFRSFLNGYQEFILLLLLLLLLLGILQALSLLHGSQIRGAMFYKYSDCFWHTFRWRTSTFHFILRR